jgi:uncharacterized protein YkwD
MIKKIFLLILLLFVGCSQHFQVRQVDVNKTYVQYLHNKERASKNIKTLELDDSLSLFAQKHAEWMATKGLMVHSNLNFDFKTRGENIAFGQKTENDVMKSWMGSTGHRRNILNSKFEYMGVGVATNKNDTIYWCVVFGSNN